GPERMIPHVTTAIALPARLLDLAFPARCPGCGHEGPPICDRCVGALGVRLDRPAGVSIGLPSDVPAPLLQLEWCAPFGGVVRRALHELKYAGETRLGGPPRGGAGAPRGPAAGGGRRATLAPGWRGWRHVRSSAGPRGATASPGIRPGRADCGRRGTGAR